MRWLPAELLALALAVGCEQTTDRAQPHYAQPSYTYQQPQEAQPPQPPPPPEAQPPMAQPPMAQPPMAEPEPSVARGQRLGIAVEHMTGELRTYFGAPPDRGVLVTRVIPGSAAEQAGLRVGDVVTFVDNRMVGDPDDVRRAVTQRSAATLDIQVIRQGTPMTLRALLAPRERPQPNQML